MHQVQYCIRHPSFAIFESCFVLCAASHGSHISSLPSWTSMSPNIILHFIRKEDTNVRIPLVRQCTVVATFTTSHQSMWLCYIVCHKPITTMFLYTWCKKSSYLLPPQKINPPLMIASKCGLWLVISLTKRRSFLKAWNIKDILEHECLPSSSDLKFVSSLHIMCSVITRNHWIGPRFVINKVSRSVSHLFWTSKSRIPCISLPSIREATKE